MPPAEPAFSALRPGVCADPAEDHAGAIPFATLAAVPDLALSYAVDARDTTAPSPVLARSFDEAVAAGQAHDPLVLLVARPCSLAEAGALRPALAEPAGHPSHRWGHRAAHTIARHLTARILGISTGNLHARIAAGGKPWFALPDGSAAPVQFSVSHCRGLVGVAVARREVGVDIEQVRPIAEMRALLSRLGGATALAAFDSLPDGPSRMRLFYRFWTGAEALLKATGAGWADEALPQNVLAADTRGLAWQLGHTVGAEAEWARQPAREPA